MEDSSLKVELAEQEMRRAVGEMKQEQRLNSAQAATKQRSMGQMQELSPGRITLPLSLTLPLPLPLTLTLTRTAAQARADGWRPDGDRAERHAARGALRSGAP